MRILLTTDTVGGVWTFTQALAKGLLERNHEVALVSFGKAPSPAQTNWVRDLRAEYRYEFEFVSSEAPLEWMDRNQQTWSEGARVVDKLAASFRPEVIHSSQFCWGALKLSAPVVVTAHSDVLSWAESCRPDGLEDSAWLRTYVRLVSEGLAGADALVAPTRWMLDALGPHYQFDCPARVVLNGVSFPGGDWRQPPPRRMRALSAGRLWDEAKGIAVLAEGDWPVPVVVAGSPSNGNSSQKLPCGVEWLGELGHEQVLAEMQSSAIYLCTSLYEPFGLAAVEAARCGCAVVCRDLPSLHEVWGESALYFTDAASLRAVLNLLSRNAVLLERMQSAAGTRAEQLQESSMTEGYLDVYKQVLEAAHA